MPGTTVRQPFMIHQKTENIHFGANTMHVASRNELFDPKLDRLSSLPCEILGSVLSFSSANEIEAAVKFTSKHISQVCHSTQLWMDLCKRTGKVSRIDLKEEFASHGSTLNSNEFEIDPLTPSPKGIKCHDDGPRNTYFSIPCVPVDFDTISAALAHFRGKDKVEVTLMPGVYDERIQIEAFSRPERDMFVCIRAAFPKVGASILHSPTSMDVQSSSWHSAKNDPCINVSYVDFSGEQSIIGLNERVTGKIHLVLSHIQILHATPGSDIWGGNCAVRVDGEGMGLTLNSCALQSDTGRGVVATNGALLHMNQTVIHDCAATGVYVGDHNSAAAVRECNILRNGGGCRRHVRERIQQNQSNSSEEPMVANRAGNSTDSDSSSADDGIDADFWFDDSAFEQDLVPPGHSGIYVETGSALIENSLISGNSLTGLSVVRGGGVVLSGCDITSNGAEPVTVEDIHDAERNEADAGLRNDVFRGGIRYGPIENNTSNLPPRENEWIEMGGRVRYTQFPLAVKERMTKAKLKLLHNHFDKRDVS